LWRGELRELGDWQKRNTNRAGDDYEQRCHRRENRTLDKEISKQGECPFFPEAKSYC
jgi:hypothetical protein